MGNLHGATMLLEASVNRTYSKVANNVFLDGFCGSPIYAGRRQNKFRGGSFKKD
jgi:hypothetical protein